MKQLKHIIQEKLKIGSNSKVHNLHEQEWEDLINNWIEEWGNYDFEYLMVLIDNFLVNNTFDNNDDYEEFFDYENDDKFKKFLTNRFIEFKNNNKKQIQNLKNK